MSLMYKNPREMEFDELLAQHAKCSPDSEMFKVYSAEILRRQVEIAMRAASAAEKSAKAATRASWAALATALAAFLTILVRTLGWF